MGKDESNLQDKIKALRCLASQSCMGDCYADFYNLHQDEEETGKKAMWCRKGNTSLYVSCPYYQSKYETCIDNGCGWLDEVADLMMKSVEALKKQDPMKIEHVIVKHGSERIGYFKCPVCGVRVSRFKDQFKYCPNCGQRLEH